MAFSAEQMNDILNNSRILCTPGGERLVESKRGNVDADYNGYGDFEGSYVQGPMMESYQPVSHNDINAYTAAQARNSKLPKAIRESMANNQVDVSGLDSPVNQLLQQQQKQMMREQSYQPVQPQTRQQPQRRQQVQERQVYSEGINYDLIRQIVEECVERKLNESNRLNESRLAGVKVCEGNKLKFVDNQGNIFLAELKYAGKGKKK